MATVLDRPRRIISWTGILVVVGLALRLLHFWRDYVVWQDEAALLANVLTKNFREMLGPLALFEAAPPLFLWLEKACLIAMGDAMYALRLMPFLASCGSLLLLTWLARQVLRADAVPWAVLLIACSDRLLWHSCEAKPYAVDVFTATAVAALFWATRRWTLTRRLLAFSAVAPVTIFLDFPGCFLIGGVMLAFVPSLLAARKGPNRSAEKLSQNVAPAPNASAPGAWLCYGLLAAVVAIAFLLLVMGPIRAQRCEQMDSCWRQTFPSWNRPWLVPWWVLKSTAEVIDYCFRPLGGCLTPLAILGAFVLYKKGRRELVVVLVAPLGLACCAGLMHAYPYTGARVMVFALPALALFIGEATAFLVVRLRTLELGWTTRIQPFSPRPRFAVHAAVAGLLALVMAPAALSLFCAIRPWQRTDWNAATGFVFQRYQTGDVIVSNAWEMSYYCRPRLGFPFHTLGDGSLPAGERQWLLIVADTEADRQKMVDGLLTPDQRLLSLASFDGVSVFCVGQSAALALEDP